MTVGSLFAGIGGFELAAQWAGLTPVWSNEIDPFCCKVLRKNFKHRIIEDDIRNIGAHNLEPVDILTGGFPCQPFSQSGKRKGTADNRYLWPEMLRVIGEVQPAYIVGENVSGLVNWSGGLVFDQIQADLENEGYEVAPFLLPACGTNAWHRRERIWFIAHLNNNGCRSGNYEVNTNKTRQSAFDEFNQVFKDATNPDSIGRERGKQGVHTSQKKGHDEKDCTSGQLRKCWGRNDLPSPAIMRVDDGIPNGLDRIKSLGNAIVPQVVYEIFRAIIEAENPRN